MLAGNYVQLFNVGDPAFAAVLNGAVVRVVSTPSAMQFTIAAREGSAVMPDGDYSNGYAGQPWLVKSMMQGTDESWLHWLNPFIQGPRAEVAFIADYAPIDGIHPSSFGESRIAQAVVAQLTRVISQRDQLTNSAADDRTLDPAAASANGTAAASSCVRAVICATFSSMARCS